MKVAVFGCLHGMLNAMYQALEYQEEKGHFKVDLVIVCGDCQTIRHSDDLVCLSVPRKYRQLGDFHEYYSGAKKVPRLTIFVGGNHEASNYLMTLPYGGWVCDNFYYLGYAGVVRGRYEKMPLDEGTIRSAYHTRGLDVLRLKLLSKNCQYDKIDVFMSHDWPVRIYDYGNREQLLRFKPMFRPDIQSREGLGNPLTEPLIHLLKPRKWFAAHLHCRFYAKVNHDREKQQTTEFLALNKIENRRNYMEFVDLTPSRESYPDDDNLYYDAEWLTILRKTVNLETNSFNKAYCPNFDDGKANAYLPTDEQIQDTISMMNESGGMQIPRNFQMVEPVIYNRNGGGHPSIDRERMKDFPNPQNEELCSRLKLSHQDESEVDSEEDVGGLPLYVDSKSES